MLCGHGHNTACRHPPPGWPPPQAFSYKYIFIAIINNKIILPSLLRYYYCYYYGQSPLQATVKGVYLHTPPFFPLHD